MTDAFEDLFHFEAEQRGLPGLPYVVVPHPLGGIREPAVRKKAGESVLAVMAALQASR